MGRRALPLALLVLVLPACSLRQLATKSVADSLSTGGTAFASDDDPQLVREAVPFALKTYESLLADLPRHGPLLVATARGFTQYAYAFVRRDAELLEASDLQAGLRLRARARRLLLRGRDYGLRALELRHRDLRSALGRGDLGPIAATTERDLDALFWTAAAWGAAITVLKDDPELIGDLPVVEAMLRRVIQIRPDYERGAAHELMIALEAGLAGGSLERAREHFRQAVALGGEVNASPYVALAENVSVQAQDRAEFVRLLEQALAVDPGREPALRLSNVLAQERARWLLARADELFVE